MASHRRGRSATRSSRNGAGCHNFAAIAAAAMSASTQSLDTLSAPPPISPGAGYLSPAISPTPPNFPRSPTRSPHHSPHYGTAHGSTPSGVPGGGYYPHSPHSPHRSSGASFYWTARVGTVLYQFDSVQVHPSIWSKVWRVKIELSCLPLWNGNVFEVFATGKLRE